MNPKERRGAFAKASAEMSEIADRDFGDAKFGEPVELSFEAACFLMGRSIEKDLKSIILALNQKPKSNRDLNKLTAQLESLGEDPPCRGDELEEMSLYAGLWRYEVGPKTEEENQKEEWRKNQELAKRIKNWAQQRIEKIKAEENLQ